jgi:hypothetical protein
MPQSRPSVRALRGKPSLFDAIAANLVLAWVAMAEPVFSKGAVPALYPTQAAAEKAAKLHFNCTGAHKMGDQWMPCAKHGQAESSQHGGHQH